MWKLQPLKKVTPLFPATPLKSWAHYAHTQTSAYERMKSAININSIDTNNVNESRFPERKPWSGKCSQQGDTGHRHTNPTNIINRKNWSSQENKIIIDC